VETSLRLEALRCAAFDSCLAHLGGGRLTRVDGATYLESLHLEEATYRLALAGVRVTRCERVPAPAAGLRPAIGLDLTPLDRSVAALDVIEVRSVSLSDASATLMRRRMPWLRAANAARIACRQLLREEDAVLTWRRVLWCSIASLRDARSRCRIRPIVFDHAALDRHPPRWTYAGEGAIERWAFA
jgi:hypothetical protein